MANQTIWHRLLDLDRRWIYLLVGLSAIIPSFMSLGLKIGSSTSVTALYDRVESLPAGSRILVSFDYGPSTGPENDPMADVLIRHCMSRDIRVVVISLFPVGGVTEAHQEFMRSIGGYDPETLEFGDWPGKRYGVDAINLGYKDGAVAAMRQMNVSFAEVWPQDYYLNQPIASFPITSDVGGYKDFNFVCSIATGSIAEFWANIVNAQYGTDVAVGCTAVSVPRYFAYLKAGQMFALLGGLKGAAEYEKLVMDNYPRVAELTRQDAYYAAKGWDVQSLVYTLLIAFVILGNVAYLATKNSEGSA